MITAVTHAEAHEFALLNCTKSSAHARLSYTTDFMEVTVLYWGRVRARRNLQLVGLQLAVTVLASVAASHISVFVSLCCCQSVEDVVCVCVCLCVCVCVVGSRLVGLWCGCAVP